MRCGLRFVGIWGCGSVSATIHQTLVEFVALVFGGEITTSISNSIYCISPKRGSARSSARSINFRFMTAT